jgi:hypothetical protein
MNILSKKFNPMWPSKETKVSVIESRICGTPESLK